MTFADKLKNLMKELDLTQTDVCKMAGIGASSISQYLSGKVEPYPRRQKKIALALGLSENFFDDPEPEPKMEITKSFGATVKVKDIAKLMHKSRDWVEQGLRERVFPWGYAVKLSKWSYFISPVRFTEETGIPIPEDMRRNK